MRHARLLSTMLAMAMVTTAAMLPGAAFAQRKKKAPAGPVVMGTDDTGDWGNNAEPDGTLGPIGDALGMDLTEGTIELADAKTLNFVIKVTSLPGPGGLPEFARYVWTMTVDDELLQLDGKFTNYTRGACDPTAGTCPPPRDPGMAPFMVRANCVENQAAAVTCEEIGLVQGQFDAAAGTITIPVSLELLGAKPGSKVTNGIQSGSNFSGIWAIPSVFASQADMPKDELLVTGTYVVPRK